MNTAAGELRVYSSASLVEEAREATVRGTASGVQMGRDACMVRELEDRLIESAFGADYVLSEAAERVLFWQGAAGLGFGATDARALAGWAAELSDAVGPMLEEAAEGDAQARDCWGDVCTRLARLGRTSRRAAAAGLAERIRGGCPLPGLVEGRTRIGLIWCADLSTARLEWLRALGARLAGSCEVVLEVPHADVPSPWSSATGRLLSGLEALGETAEVGAEPFNPLLSDSVGARLARAMARREPFEGSGVVPHEARDADDEARVAARYVRAALERGTPPERIAVALPTVHTGAARVCDALDALGTPFALGAGLDLERTPPVGWFLKLAESAAAGLRAGDLADLLASLYAQALHERAGAPHARTSVARRLARVARALGPDAEVEVVRGHLRRAGPADGIAAVACQVVDHLRAMLVVLGEATELAAVVRALRALVEASGLAESILPRSRPTAELQALVASGSGELAAADARAYGRDRLAVEALVATLEELEQGARDAGNPPGGAHDGVALLRSMLGSVFARRAGDVRAGGVRVGSFASLVAREFDVVILLGLTADAWPRPARGSAGSVRSLKEAEQDACIQLHALASAQRELVILRPRADARGRPMLASPWFDAVAHVIGTERLREPPHAGGVDVACGLSAVLCDVPVGVSVERLAEDGPARLSALRVDGLDLASVGARIALERARLREMLVRSAAEVTMLPEPGLYGRVLTATELGSMAACPFQRFARYRLGVRLEDELGAGPSPSSHGETAHAALEAAVSALLASGHGQYRTENVTAIDELARPAAKRAARERLAPRGFDPAIVESYTREIVERVCAVLRVLFAQQDAVGLVGAEITFGGPPGGWPAAEFASSDATAPIRVRGRIDVVERGQEGLRVLDVKAASPSTLESRLRRERKLEGALQLPLYAAAAAQATGEVADGRYVSMRDGALSSLWSQRKATDPPPDLAARVHALAAAMARGSIAVRPDSDACRACDLQALCRWVGY